MNAGSYGFPDLDVVAALSAKEGQRDWSQMCERENQGGGLTRDEEATPSFL